MALLAYLLLTIMRKRWAMREAAVPSAADWTKVSTVKVEIDEAAAPAQNAGIGSVFKRFSDSQADRMMVLAEIASHDSVDAKEEVLCPYYQVTHNSVFYEDTGSSLNSSLEAPIHGAAARALALLSPVCEQEAAGCIVNSAAEQADTEAAGCIVNSAAEQADTDHLGVQAGQLVHDELAGAGR
jgi:hypothetical protein